MCWGSKCLFEIPRVGQMGCSPQNSSDFSIWISDEITCLGNMPSPKVGIPHRLWRFCGVSSSNFNRLLIWFPISFVSTSLVTLVGSTFTKSLSISNTWSCSSDKTTSRPNETFRRTRPGPRHGNRSQWDLTRIPIKWIPLGCLKGWLSFVWLIAWCLVD